MEEKGGVDLGLQDPLVDARCPFDSIRDEDLGYALLLSCSAVDAGCKR